MKQVYVHGLGQTPASWDQVLQRLGKRTDCVCPDLTKMTSAEETTYPNLYRAFARLCDTLDGPLDLCGLSLGGVLSLHYAAEHPDRVHALVLIAPQYKMPKTLLRIQNTLFRILPTAAFPATGFTKEQFLQLCSSMTDLDFRRTLPAITCPVLVVCGSRDHVNQKACIALSKLLPRAKLEIAARAGHEVNLEAPEQLAALLYYFYEEIN